MTARGLASVGPAGGGVRVRWRLAPLLALRSLAEDREREDLGRALAAARRAEDEVAAKRRKLLALQGSLPGSRAVMLAAELAGLDRYLDRFRRGVAESTERAIIADAAAVEARRRHARAREAREALERERERWLGVRRREREACLERELDDAPARGRMCEAG